MFAIAQASRSSLLAPSLRQTSAIQRTSRGFSTSSQKDSDSFAITVSIASTLGVGFFTSILGFCLGADSVSRELPALRILSGVVTAGILGSTCAGSALLIGFVFPRSTVAATAILAGCIIHDIKIVSPITNHSKEENTTRCKNNKI